MTERAWTTRDGRTRRPPGGDERALLEAFMDFHRDTLLWKLSGLSEEQARRTFTPSGMSLLGMVKHLAYVERWWFAIVFAGLDLPLPWSEADPNADFRIEPGETVESIVDLYRAECARSRDIVAAVSLDAMAKNPVRPHSLRRILLHMIEETARHNGHADIFRELIDGETGE